MVGLSAKSVINAGAEARLGSVGSWSRPAISEAIVARFALFSPEKKPPFWQGQQNLANPALTDIRPRARPNRAAKLCATAAQLDHDSSGKEVVRA